MNRTIKNVVSIMAIVLMLLSLCSFAKNNASVENIQIQGNAESILIRDANWLEFTTDDTNIISEIIGQIEKVPVGKDSEHPNLYGADYLIVFTYETGETCSFVLYDAAHSYYDINEAGYKYIQQTEDGALMELKSYLDELYEENAESLSYMPGYDPGLSPVESDTITQPIETDTPPVESDTVIPPIESDTDTDSCVGDGDSGCKSTLTGIAIIPTALAAGLVVFKKRKK